MSCSHKGCCFRIAVVRVRERAWLKELFRALKVIAQYRDFKVVGLDKIMSALVLSCTIAVARYTIVK